jgi:hypothetical protein
MKVNKVGKHLTKSYSQWKEYINENRQYTILKKELPKSINKTKNVLSKLNTEFLGKYNHYLDVKFIKTKTQEAYERTKRFINK